MTPKCFDTDKVDTPYLPIALFINESLPGKANVKERKEMITPTLSPFARSHWGGGNPAGKDERS